MHIQVTQGLITESHNLGNQLAKLPSKSFLNLPLKRDSWQLNKLNLQKYPQKNPTLYRSEKSSLFHWENDEQSISKLQSIFHYQKTSYLTLYRSVSLNCATHFKCISAFIKRFTEDDTNLHCMLYRKIHWLSCLLYQTSGVLDLSG